MNRRLISLPFLSLYIAAVLAIVLNFTSGRWGSMPWFPVAVGITAAMAILPLRFLFKKKLLDRSSSDWWRIVFFFFFFAGLAPFAGIPFLGREDALLIAGLLVMSALFLWAAFGTMFQWPGFRPPLQPGQCRRCRYDLTNNESGICPECGTPVSTGER